MITSHQFHEQVFERAWLTACPRVLSSRLEHIDTGHTLGNPNTMHTIRLTENSCSFFRDPFLDICEDFSGYLFVSVRRGDARCCQARFLCDSCQPSPDSYAEGSVRHVALYTSHPFWRTISMPTGHLERNLNLLV